MKKPRLILYWFICFVLLSALAGCQPASSTGIAPIPQSTLASTATALPSPSSAPTNTPEPVFTSVPNSIRQSDDMEMVFVPAGKFTMGGEGGEPDEGPIHEVYLDAYWMDLTEITNAMYGLCVEAGACMPPVELSSYTHENYFGNALFANYPVIFVDWSMANAYCQWAGVRLPTEAEWEKAARGEGARIFPWGEAWDVQKYKRLNFADRSNPELAADLSANDGYRDTAPVGSFPAGRSPYGIYDLDGNVWEWVADWYDPLYYNYSPMNNPQGPEGPTQDITMRSTRGGGWVAANENVFHTYNRHGVVPDSVSSSIGFRCAR